MVQDTDESQARATVVVDEPVAAAAVAATIAATGVAVAASRVVIVQVVDIVVGVELLARGQSQGNKSHDLWLISVSPFVTASSSATTTTIITTDGNTLQVGGFFFPKIFILYLFLV